MVKVFILRPFQFILKSKIVSVKTRKILWLSNKVLKNELSWETCCRFSNEFSIHLIWPCVSVMYNDWELAVRVCARAITTCNTVHLYYCPIHYPFSPRSLEMILLKIFLVILSIVIVALFSFQWCKQFVYLFSVSVGSLVQVRLVPAPVLDSLRVFFVMCAR